jgi:hypothetical protein
MTIRTKNATKAAGKRRLSLAKRTLKDLSVKGKGPKGGFLMRDTVIIRTGGR